MEQVSPIDTVIARFEPISLSEMDGVKLQMRMDTKYMFSERQLPVILESLTKDYRILEVDGIRGTRYRSLYFDTPGRKHYLDHQNGRTFRSKVRFREYLGSDLVFLEVKRKTGRGGTDKARLRVPSIPVSLEAEHRSFVERTSRNEEPLVPVLWNTFSRITLVHRTRPERLTIDRSLVFTDTDGEAALSDICVAELKEGRTGHGSPFSALMREHVIAVSGMSKYCIGLIQLGKAPKYNRFKETLLRMERMRAA